MIKIESKLQGLDRHLKRLYSDLSDTRISNELTERCILSVRRDIEIHNYIKKLIDEDKSIY